MMAAEVEVVLSIVPVFRFALILSTFPFSVASFFLRDRSYLSAASSSPLLDIGSQSLCCKLFMASFYLQHLFLLLLSHPTHFTGPHHHPPEASSIALLLDFVFHWRSPVRIFKPENSEWILRKSTLPFGNCGFFKIEEKRTLAFRRHRASVQSNHAKSVFTRGGKG